MLLGIIPNALERVWLSISRKNVPGTNTKVLLKVHCEIHFQL